MKRSRTKLFALVLLSLAAALPLRAVGLANRVFVSQRSGNDANSCSNILTPCQTFAGAVTQVAGGGEVIVLDSGGYGPVTIGKALTIEAPPGVLAFIHPPSGNAVTISAGASDNIVLRGLTLNGSGDSVGISIGTAANVFIENCTISQFENGIEVDQPVAMQLKDSLIRENFEGVFIVPPSGTAFSTIEHCRIESNDGGVIQYDNSDTTVADSVIAHNAETGLSSLTQSTGTSVMTVTNCVITYNNTGVYVDRLNPGGTPIARVGYSTVTNGADGFRNISGTFQSLGNNFMAGNSFEDYDGTVTVISPK